MEVQGTVMETMQYDGYEEEQSLHQWQNKKYIEEGEEEKEEENVEEQVYLGTGWYTTQRCWRQRKSGEKRTREGNFKLIFPYPIIFLKV